VLGFSDDVPLLHKMGLDVEVLDPGCCGMAGAFGYEHGHYDVSVACAQRALIPAVHRADDDTIIIADGFSCREQIAQLTHRRALHTAEVLALATQTNPAQSPLG
jgi:Fe-S oxidoreductase